MKKKLDLNLVGLNGNAYAILSFFRQEAKQAGWTPEEIEKTTDEAKAGDYSDLLAVIQRA